MPKRLKSLSSEVLHRNPWWVYKRDTYTLPNGKNGEYYYAETSGFSMIVPVLPDGRVVLVLQHRYLSDKQSIEFPAGAVDGDKNVLAAAQRELREETGYLSDMWRKIGVFHGSKSMIKNNIAHIFLAHVSSCSAQELDETEEIGILFRTPQEVDTMIRDGSIWDGSTIAAWYLVRPSV